VHPTYWGVFYCFTIIVMSGKEKLYHTSTEEKEISISTQVDNKLDNLNIQSSTALQTVERELQEEKKEEVKNGAWLAFSQWLEMKLNGKLSSATRLQWGGSFFKWGKLQTDLYTQLNLSNMKDPSGFLWANKQIYKWLNLDGIYFYQNSNQNKTWLGLRYIGQTKSGGYQFGVYPLTSEGVSGEVFVNLNRKIGKDGKASAWVLADIVWKGFWGEAEYVHDLTRNLSAFVQARYGGTFKSPSISGVAGVRMNLK